MRRVLRLGVALVTVTALLASCTSGSSTAPADDAADAGTNATDGIAVVVGGTQAITVSNVAADTPVTLIDEHGVELLTLITDDLGQAHTGYVPDEPLTVETGGDNIIQTGQGRSLQPGAYRFEIGEGDEAYVTEAVEVSAIDGHPEVELYERQELPGLSLGVLGDLPEGADPEDGYNYIEMRDGVQLSAMVRFPDQTLYGDGPWPTVVEYSGYDAISNPQGEQPGMLIARALGFATVGVSMRGTGCSGGVFDVFSPAQQADGYDIVETVARQPWVKGDQVGMVGLSYSGITQLYTAATNPPSLAAIVPQSVIVDPWVQQWPGGIYNDGFTRQWLAERNAQAAAGGVGWVSERVDGDDEICTANMDLRSQNIDFESFGRSLEFRPVDAEGRDLRELVHQIDVPVLLTGAFQDEQTGPLFADMADHFDAAPVVRVNLWNGRHPDGYSSMNIPDMFEFLSLYVDESVPQMNELVRLGLPAELASQFGVESAPELAPDRFVEQFGDDLDAALAAYEAEDPVRVVFENGAGSPEAGAPGGTFELRFESWPAPQAEERTWYLDADGSLLDEPGDVDGTETYDHDPDAAQENFFGEEGYQLLTALWDIDWTRFSPRNAAVWLSEPLDEDLVLGGPGVATLWFGSDEADADVQVTLSEVRPDGVEYLLQSGWLRIGHRKVDETTTRGLRLGRSFIRADYEPIPAGELVEARLALPSVAAPLRAGSRLRVEVSSPGRNHGTWVFEDPYGDGETPTHRLGFGPSAPSALTLSVLRGVAVPPGAPPCPSLRGQPCRSGEPGEPDADQASRN